DAARQMTQVRCAFFALCLSLASVANAQETRLGSDFRREGEAIKTSCSSFNLKSLGSCAYTLFTDHQMHIAAGSLAPQNGFAFGPALVYHWTPNDSWRLSWKLYAAACVSA